MPASITFSAVSFANPDGDALFTDITLQFGPERTGLVGRNGTGKTTLLRLIAGQAKPTSGSVQVAGRIGWLKQTQGGPDTQTIADLFGVQSALALLDRAAAGAATPDDLAEADWTLEARMQSALEHCGLPVDPRSPLSSLSGGQQTRAALAAMIFQAPDILLLDEPTNNLDAEGRGTVHDLLADWQGAAIVVSHDRALLDQMDAIVELTSLGATRYGGPYSTYQALKAAELHAAEHDLADARKHKADLTRRAQEAAERKARSDKAGRKLRASGSQPKMMMDAAKERSESSGAAADRMRADRQGKAQAAVESAESRLEILQPIKMDLPSTGLAPSKRVLTVEGLTGGHDPASPVVHGFSLDMIGPERVALTGPNGAGKTTALALITGRLAPLSGQVRFGEDWVLLDQAVDLLAPGETLRENYRRLNPDEDENASRAALARFKFRADDALQTAGTLSGGQRLRAGLACTLGRCRPPGLLILDEPTNHLDLDAITALESALTGYDGAILVVSHDPEFLRRIGVTRHIPLSAGKSG